ncbi:MAG: prolipoprotein diacylglyceryl transferase [Anaerolineaceae bacterium]
MIQGFNIGPLTIRFYALIILAGALFAAWLTSQNAKHFGRDGEKTWDLLPILLVFGIIGARLWHVFTPSASNAAAGITTAFYLANPIEILKTWQGGLGIPGAVIGGLIGLLIYTHFSKESFAEWSDFLAPGLLIAQAIGRWGNFVNQELYGGPSNLPWAIKIDPQYRLKGFESVELYHPLFLYESILNVLGGLFLLYAARKWREKLYKGDIFIMYLVIYPMIRFFMEFLRLDPSPVNGININQTIMGIVAVLAALYLLYRHFVRAPKAGHYEFDDEEGIEVSGMISPVVETVEPEFLSKAIAEDHWPTLAEMSETMRQFAKKE